MCSFSIKSLSFSIVLGLVMPLLTCSVAFAQANEKTTYPTTQSNRTWQSRHGNFSFEGKAVRREGNYVEFKTDKSIDIWLPVRYLDSSDVAILDNLKNGGAPGPSSITQSGRSFGSPSMSTDSGSGSNSSSANSGTNSTENSETESPEGTPEEPEVEVKKPRPYRLGEFVEVQVKGKWFRGRVTGLNIAKERYFISYQDGPIPRSNWFPIDDTRALVKEEEDPEQESTDETATDSATEAAS